MGKALQENIVTKTITEVSEQEAAVLLYRCQTDPLFHVREVQGCETLETFQEDLFRAVWEFERVAVQSCHDMGKTFTLSRVILAIGSSFPGSKIVTTAPTARQVELLLWSEIRAGHAKSKYPLGGKVLTKKWEFSPDWWAIGFTTPKQASTGEGQVNSSFQGVHSPVLVFVVFDEATGIPPDVWKQLEGLMTSAFVKFVAIGNPTSKSSEFYRCFSDPMYKKLRLTCFHSPNLVVNNFRCLKDLLDELDILKELDEEGQIKRLHSYLIKTPHLITARWVMGMALRLGVDHPLFVSKCLGEFPNEDERCLMPLAAVEEAQQRERPELRSKHAVYIGVDPARFGSDTSVITRQHETWVKEVKRLQKRSTTELAGSVISMVSELSDEERIEVVIIVDATGIGSGVVDNLNEFKARHEIKWRGVRVIELHFGETFKECRDGSERVVAEKKAMYVNKKAEMFVLLAQDLKKDLVLPEKSDFYSEQLPTMIYQFDSKGRWVIEDKERYKKRTGRSSPDEADSLALSNYARYYSAGIGKFTENLTKITGKTFAGSFRK